MEIILYLLGTLAGFVPLVIHVPLPAIIFSVYMAMSFMSAMMLFIKIPAGQKAFMLYLPTVFALLSFIKGPRPRIGIALIMMAMLLQAVLAFDNLMDDKRIIKDEDQRTVLRFQVIGLLGVALYMINGTIPLANIARSAAN